MQSSIAHYMLCAYIQTGLPLACTTLEVQVIEERNTLAEESQFFVLEWYIPFDGNPFWHCHHYENGDVAMSAFKEGLIGLLTFRTSQCLTGESTAMAGSLGANLLQTSVYQDGQVSHFDKKKGYIATTSGEDRNSLPFWSLAQFELLHVLHS